MKNGHVRSKIKRTKIIRHFNPPPLALHDHSDWRVLLGSKLKSLKIMHSSDQSSHQLAQKIMAFSGLRSLSISLPNLVSYAQLEDHLEYAFTRLYCFTFSLKHFKKLNFQRKWKVRNYQEFVGLVDLKFFPERFLIKTFFKFIFSIFHLEK